MKLTNMALHHLRCISIWYLFIFGDVKLVYGDVSSVDAAFVTLLLIETILGRLAQMDSNAILFFFLDGGSKKDEIQCLLQTAVATVLTHYQRNAKKKRKRIVFGLVWAILPRKVAIKKVWRRWHRLLQLQKQTNRTPQQQEKQKHKRFTWPS